MFRKFITCGVWGEGKGGETEMVNALCQSRNLCKVRHRRPGCSVCSTTAPLSYIAVTVWHGVVVCSSSRGKCSQDCEEQHIFAPFPLPRCCSSINTSHHIVGMAPMHVLCVFYSVGVCRRPQAESQQRDECRLRNDCAARALPIRCTQFELFVSRLVDAVSAETSDGLNSSASHS